MTECGKVLQPALDGVASWCHRWKVELSGAKCTYTTFTLDPKETKGKKKITLKIQDKPLPTAASTLPYEAHPVFLGLTLDDQLTFRPHAEKIKARMASRRYALSRLAGKTYGAKTEILRTAYMTTTRAVADYAIGTWMVTAKPTTRAIVEAEQNKCSRLISGCIRATPTDMALRAAGLQPLHVRAKERAAILMERAKRLPAGAPIRNIAETEVTPRLKSRAYEGYQRVCNTARDRGEPPPPLPNEDAAIPSRPCWRRIANRTVEAAEISDLRREPLTFIPKVAPWDLKGDPSKISFNPGMPNGTERTASETSRRETAMAALGNLTDADTVCWTDGSAIEGTRSGGSGAFIQLPDGSTMERRVPSGKICSSYRAELTAIREALSCIQGLSEGVKNQIRSIRICTDSKSAIQRLAGGPLDQRDDLCGDIWTKLLDLSSSARVLFQWVPSHCGLEGNEKADTLAGEASGLQQEEVPVDLNTVRRLSGGEVRLSGRIG